ncbi:hypothetical protein PBV87_01975 [Niameybacter massiliensis]|uniref:DUF892 family protein n=1 Tax=Holtiella tumoricola TaxID=3018743 RepID=A0AA42DJT9_9FIRM|nr:MULTISPECIES: hypothetical protein [Lachnospirales]MDA3730274.1 hypothetical protein [Holtiella tumoricola]
MNENVEVLNFIYQNSEMGTNTLTELIEIAGDVPFEQVLLKELEGYKAINKEAISLLEAEDHEPKGIKKLDQIKTYIMIKASTLNNQSASHLAEMLIQGSTMGTVDMCKKLNSYKNLKDEVRALGQHLLEFEEGNIEELKEYLRQGHE